MDDFRTFWNGLDWSALADMVFSVLPALVCITLHELAHGYTAYRLGDATAKKAGRLTLNPLRHIDWFGLIMMVSFRFGWAKPVPVNMRNFKNPRLGMAVTAAAGPLCNLVLGAAFLFVYGLAYSPLTAAGTTLAEGALRALATAAWLSLSLAVFNLLPISPLDGSKVVFSFLSDGAYARLMRYERYGMVLLLVLVWTGVLGRPLSAVTGWLYDRLFPLAEWGFALTAGAK